MESKALPNIYEYFALLSPSDRIKEAVDDLKQELHSVIGLADYNRLSIAHVALFKLRAEDDISVIDLMKKSIGNYKPFEIKLNGLQILSQKEGTKTLCLQIDDPSSIISIVKSLYKKPRKPRQKRPTVVSPISKKTLIKTFSFKKAVVKKKAITKPPSKKPPLIFPNITIARNITTADFERIEDFTPFDYHDEWLCDRITVLKRLDGSTLPFGPVKDVMLG